MALLSEAGLEVRQKCTAPAFQIGLGICCLENAVICYLSSLDMMNRSKNLFVLEAM